MDKFLFVFALTIITVSADPIHYDNNTDEINKVIDDAIFTFEQSETFDPMKVPDHIEKFERNIGHIDLKGELDLRNIQIRGLKQLKRMGNANIKNDEEDGIIKAHFILGLHDANIVMEYDLGIKLGQLYPNTHVITDIHDFSISLSVEIDKQGKWTMTAFEVEEFKKIVNHIGGLSLLDPILDIIADVLMLAFRDSIRDEMTRILAPAFKRELEKDHPSFFFYQLIN